ncbi:fibronectin type III domain-containing protein [Streptosporangium lutulentum]
MGRLDEPERAAFHLHQRRLERHPGPRCDRELRLQRQPRQRHPVQLHPQRRVLCRRHPAQPRYPGHARAPSVSGTTNSSISLSWGASSGTVTGYRVYEGTTQRAQVTGTGATVGSLGACTSHTYTVRAYNAQGESAASAPASATTTGCTNPRQAARWPAPPTSTWAGAARRTRPRS